MELIDAIHQINQQSIQASGPTDLVMGTVTSESPLEITTNPAMGSLKRQVLVLTSNVVEKKIPLLSHTHTTPEGATGSALDAVACMEHGRPLPVEGGYILLNRGLKTGDRVLLLRVQSGQKFVVLSRVFD